MADVIPIRKVKKSFRQVREMIEDADPGSRWSCKVGFSWNIDKDGGASIDASAETDVAQAAAILDGLGSANVKTGMKRAYDNVGHGYFEFSISGTKEETD